MLEATSRSGTGLLKKRSWSVHEEVSVSVSVDGLSVGLLGAAESLRHALAGFEPDLLCGADCAVVVETLAATEKACAGARARAAARAASHGAHRDRGFADAADWLARHTGSSRGEARMALETASEMESLPQTKPALLAGEVSLAQAHEIADAENEAPGSESELLTLARRSGLNPVRDKARGRRLAAADPEELNRRQHRAREFRHWRDRLGMVRFLGALDPEVGTPLMNRLDAECDRIRRAARRDGPDEPREAHAADALASMLSGSGRGRANRADVVIVCDLAAYRRGHAHPGEPCHLIGGGPIPVRRVREVADDAFLKAVVHDGVRIEAVAHLGRYISTELRTALELGGVPHFEGKECVEVGCGRRYGLEWDHDDPVAHRGPTSYENLKARCWPHHQEKTERDRQAGLLGPFPP